MRFIPELPIAQLLASAGRWAAAPGLALAKPDRKGIARLREEERNFNAKRNKSFGNPNYQLKGAA